MYFTRLALTILITATTAAFAPVAASANNVPQGTVTFAKLGPFAGHDERGTVQLFVRPKSSKVAAGVIGGDDLTEFTFALSSRRCSGVANNPSDPGYIGETEKNLFDAKPIQGIYIDDIIIGAVPKRDVRATRSIVLLGTGKGGELEPRACGDASTAPLRSSRFKPKRKSILIGLLLPFADRTERASVQLTIAGRSGPDALALVGDFNRDGDVAYSLRLSRRSCAAVARNPDRPGFIGPELIGPTAFSGTTFDDESVVNASNRKARSAKSIVLVGREGSGSKFEPRACGAVYKLQDLLVSS
jgi:hypothetical protein